MTSEKKGNHKKENRENEEEEITQEIIQETFPDLEHILILQESTKCSAQLAEKDPHEGTSSQNFRTPRIKKKISKSFHKEK